MVIEKHRFRKTKCMNASLCSEKKVTELCEKCASGLEHDLVVMKMMNFGAGEQRFVRIQFETLKS